MKYDLKQIGHNISKGLIDPIIFHDPDIYQLELERVFARTWQFVGHESMLKNSGDYLTTFMAEDPVIVVRGRAGQVRVFLNRCRHRGVHLCNFDRGNTKAFSCPYHGWSYNTEGKLISVPNIETFGSGFNRENWGLVEIPQVANYAGLIFANMDPGAMSLDSFLGDMRFYFDNLFGRKGGGGLEMSAIKQRVRSSHNWKISADNGSDLYHFGVTHGGAIDTLQDYSKFFLPNEGGSFMATTGDQGGPSHSVIYGRGMDAKQYDLSHARRLGPESVEYIERRYRDAEGGDTRVGPGASSVAMLFPNLLFVDMGPLTAGVAVEQFHPKGVAATESWTYVHVEKDAPQPIKEFAAKQMMRFHSATGSVVPDDHENWDRMGAGTGSPRSRSIPLAYIQGAQAADRAALCGGGGFEALPGFANPGVTEQGARTLYSYWFRLMQEA